jgi:hypothetical protein
MCHRVRHKAHEGLFHEQDVPTSLSEFEVVDVLGHSQFSPRGIERLWLLIKSCMRITLNYRLLFYHGWNKNRKFGAREVQTKVGLKKSALKARCSTDQGVSFGD